MAINNGYLGGRYINKCPFKKHAILLNAIKC